MEKTSQFITQCKGDISHAFKIAKIIVIFAVLKGVTYVAITLCYKLGSFFYIGGLGDISVTFDVSF